MIYDEFFASLLNYWGEYERSGIGLDTEDFCKSKISEKYLPVLLDRLQIEIPAGYRTPSIAEIWKAFKQLEKEKVLDHVYNKSIQDLDKKAIAYNQENHHEKIQECFSDLKKELNITTKYDEGK